jgi:hypothetical protein
MFPKLTGMFERKATPPPFVSPTSMNNQGQTTVSPFGD